MNAAATFGWDKAQGGDLAYIPSGGLFTGAIAAWLASAVHAFTAAAFEAPALVALEESVLRWLAGILGPLVISIMAVRILRYRNTQAATGVLFAGVILTFIGEMSAALLYSELHVPL